MYQHMTFEKILSNMLKNVPSNLDKREGSIIYDALAPCALELTHTYIEFDTILNETFSDTATREYLIRRCNERNIYPKEATYAVLKGEFNIDVPLGARFSLKGLNYEVFEKVSNNVFKVVCEEKGVQGNKNFGVMIPIGYIQGLERAELTELLIPAEDEEDTEALRKRYFETFQSESYGGNVKDYIQRCNALDGVGCTKVTPVWNGGGTVKLTILDSEYNKASLEHISFVQETIDPTQDGLGYGIAPIGHIVTVDTAKEVLVNISTSLVFENGYTFEMLQDDINDSLEKYLLELRKTWDSSTIVVRISNIESRILNITGIIDILGTTINGSNTNLTLDCFSIPVMRTGGVVNE